jgi:hypothetical protein
MSESLLKLYTYGVELPAAILGLQGNTGRRFTTIAGATALYCWVKKPNSLFKDDGSPREWAIWSNDNQAVPLNWFAVSALAGTLGVLFI